MHIQVAVRVLHSSAFIFILEYISCLWFQLEEGTLNISKIDVCICTTGIFNKLKPLHKILRTKMPTPRRGTVHMVIAISYYITLLQSYNIGYSLV